MRWRNFLKICIYAFLGIGLIVVIVDAFIIGGWYGFLTFAGGIFMLLISVSIVMIYIHMSETLDRMSEDISELNNKQRTAAGSAKTQLRRVHTARNTWAPKTDVHAKTPGRPEKGQYPGEPINGSNDGDNQEADQNDVWFCTKCGSKNNGGAVCSSCYVSR
jgi:hypothetical protein